MAMEIYFAFTYHSPFEEDKLLVFNRISYFTPPLNADGFRQTPIPDAAMDNDTTRILFLGDSFTFGLGMEDGGLRFTSLLEQRLNAESTLHYHIYNAGKSGTAPHNWVGYLRKLLPTYKPNIVFAVFFLRDGSGIALSLAAHRKHIALLRHEYADSWLYHHSHIARAVIDYEIAQAFNKRYYRDAVINAYVGDEKNRKIWKFEQENLRKLNAICAHAGIPFHLVIFPALLDLHNYPFQAVEDEVFNFAHTQNIPVVSLNSGFLGRDEHMLWIGPGDQHPNALGHKIAADTLYPYLKSSLKSLEVK